MSDVIPPPTLLADLLKIFTIEQLEMFLHECEEVIHTHGFGDVIVTFEGRHPQNLEQRRSRQFPKPNNYIAE